MELTEKVVNALQGPLEAEYVRLNDDDSITGVVVSSVFIGMATIDRQRLIDEMLRHAAEPLTRDELRRVIMIAALTPREYESVGVRIRVDISDLEDGALEVLLRGTYSDAAYVRGTLVKQDGITTSEPVQRRGFGETLIAVRVMGTDEHPLTRDKVINLLSGDRYIEVLQNV